MNSLFESTACISTHIVFSYQFGKWSFVIWYKCFSSISYLILISIIKMTLFIIQKVPWCLQSISPYSTCSHTSNTDCVLISVTEDWCPLFLNFIWRVHIATKRVNTRHTLMSDLFCLMQFLSLPPKCVPFHCWIIFHCIKSTTICLLSLHSPAHGCLVTMKKAAKTF